MDKLNSSIQNPKSKIQNRNVSPARLAVFEILQKIEMDRAYSSALLPIYEEKLQPKDRALCHTLTLGVLRNQIYLDRLIEKLTTKKTNKFDLAVLLALRLGLYQLIFLDKIPAHAAINESVNLVQRAKKTSAKNLVNAVLRRATREKIELEFADEPEKICVESSYPRWLFERWIREFGFEEAKKLAVASNETPNLVFRLTAKSGAKTIEILKKIGLEIIESEIAANAWKVFGSNEILRLYAADGKIYFQDEASQLVAQAVKLKAGESFLDVCAAPGSKVTQIQDSKFRIQNSGFKIQDSRFKIQELIIAGDYFEHRVRILQANCRKQGADFINIVRYDAENALPFADDSFDVVLIDAPCSGTGTIRHNPEIRYFLSEKDFAELSAKQLKILQIASKTVKKNGRLIYSTCSLESEENEAVIEKFLARNENFTKVTPKVWDIFLTGESFARTFPPRDKTDGFFIAEMIKR
ncbi:MAG: 16S rRNA (cytosine(967)-C(5))-methyltransferase RsmB [Acidobacteriota bacterium]|nr:16S rRNA (cytosine(967)-C(5))-methyltransferase RsmB [Acidobacteriota bacterium]